MAILENILKRVHALPTLPASAMRVIALTKDPSTSARELETVINQDLSLATAMLRQANSSYYGHQRKISSIQEAIVLLGFQATQGLAMSYAIAPILKSNLTGYNIEQEELWKHSLLTAMAAECLCNRKHLPFNDVAFTAGLLHDIGKLIISIYVQEVSTSLQEKAKETKLPYVEFEEKVIGYSHATVGGFMAKAWNLPVDLVEAITYHHSPSHSQNHRGLADVIHVANGVASILGISGGSDSFLNPIQQEPLDRLGINKSDVEYLITGLGKCLLDPTLFS